MFLHLRTMTLRKAVVEPEIEHLSEATDNQFLMQIPKQNFVVRPLAYLLVIPASLA